jgi:NADPH:quinone reductase-like Zn-dependent oxidoreductase
VLQLCKYWGFREIITTCNANEHGELVTQLGATRVIDYAEQDFAQVIPPRSLDVCYDAIGGDPRICCFGGERASLESRSLALVKRRGLYVSILSGVTLLEETGCPAACGQGCGAAASGCVLLASLITRKATAATLGPRYSGPYFQQSPGSLSRSGLLLRELSTLVDEGALRPIVCATFDLSRASDAHRFAETGRHPDDSSIRRKGKVIVATSD